MVKKPFKFT